MAAQIITRGRGPEVKGTRVTVYRIMDFAREGGSADRMASALHVTAEQVRVALDYIATHRSDVEAEYGRILRRAQQPNAPYVEAGRARSAEELQRRIRARGVKDVTHADSGGKDNAHGQRTCPIKRATSGFGC